MSECQLTKLAVKRAAGARRLDVGGHRVEGRRGGGGAGRLKCTPRASGGEVVGRRGCGRMGEEMFHVEQKRA